MKKFGIEIEILSKFVKSGNKIIETPINYSGRSFKNCKKENKLVDKYLNNKSVKN